MNTNLLNIFKIIETNLFGKYFISMSNGYSPMKGEFSTNELKLFNLNTIVDCKDILGELYKERGLVDSKYGYMGRYFIKSVTFDVEQHPTIGVVYVPTLVIEYEFKEINWNDVEKGGGSGCQTLRP